MSVIQGAKKKFNDSTSVSDTVATNLFIAQLLIMFVLSADPSTDFRWNFTNFRLIRLKVRGITV